MCAHFCLNIVSWFGSMPRGGIARPLGDFMLNGLRNPGSPLFGFLTDEALTQAVSFHDRWRPSRRHREVRPLGSLGEVLPFPQGHGSNWQGTLSAMFLGEALLCVSGCALAGTCRQTTPFQGCEDGQFLMIQPERDLSSLIVSSAVSA